ncbi:MAG: galactokinase, partial [Acidimicrobiales bacterium]
MNTINATFKTHFGDDARAFTVIAPGRVNLIGEHVDYNAGLVLPIAISRRTLLRVRPRDDRRVILFAAQFDETREFSLDAISHQNAWIDYVQGVAAELEKRFSLRGFEGVIESDVPMASGLSSSAALEVGAALAFLQVGEYSLAPREVALLCQKAENGFIGVNSGIMDQMAVAACQKNHALLLDCRSLETEQIPFLLRSENREYSLIVTDSGAPRELASSAYNERRAQCELGLKILREKLSHIETLRDVSPEELACYENLLPEVVRRRVRHVVEEIARTKSAVESLRQGDLVAFGARMNESHDSLRDLYEVSSSE